MGIFEESGELYTGGRQHERMGQRGLISGKETETQRGIWEGVYLKIFPRVNAVTSPHLTFPKPIPMSLNLFLIEV